MILSMQNYYRAKRKKRYIALHFRDSLAHNLLIINKSTNFNI